MQKRWLIKDPADRTTINQLSSTVKVDPIIAELLAQRGISTYEEAQAFFRPTLEELHDPFLMKDMDTAVKALDQAIEKKENIMLYGDYDVDGTTSVAMMYTFLNEIANVSYYIPDRYKEGYGVSDQGIDYAIEQGVELLITLDCGIKAVDKIDRARKAGITVIVCDHHTPGEQLPNAIVLDPKRSDCEYPCKELSGCGVGFKLLQGLVQKRGDDHYKLFELLDFLAISIGADIVDVTGENRILAFYGLKQLNENPRLAFDILVKTAKRSFPLTLTDVVFTIAPRINAAGRLESADLAVDLMISKDKEVIQNLANEIEEHNTNRKELDQSITDGAVVQMQSRDGWEELNTTVVHHADWHKGVVGIVASRLIEQHYRPTIVFSGNDELTGSARSIPGLDIYGALLECEDLLTRFGGHKYAAGLSLEEKNLSAFKERFEEVVAKRLKRQDRTELVSIDAELSFDQLFRSDENRLKLPRLKRIIDQFEPFGPGNMKPTFLSRNVYSVDLRVLKEKHLKLTLNQPPHDLNIDGIGFNLGEKADEAASGVPFDLVYTLESNTWNGRTTLQLNIKDLRSSV